MGACQSLRALLGCLLQSGRVTGRRPFLPTQLLSSLSQLTWTLVMSQFVVISGMVMKRGTEFFASIVFLMSYEPTEQSERLTSVPRLLVSTLARLPARPCNNNVNPRPSSVFRHIPQCRGGGATPPGVSKLSVVELSGTNQRIALDEYSRLVVRF